MSFNGFTAVERSSVTRTLVLDGNERADRRVRRRAPKFCDDFDFSHSCTDRLSSPSGRSISPSLLIESKMNEIHTTPNKMDVMHLIVRTSGSCKAEVEGSGVSSITN